MTFRILLGSLIWLATLTGASAQPIFEVSVNDIDGQKTALAPYRGRVLLIVNVASACGYTGQYEGLQALYAKYQKRGLTVLGFPCNQFGGQESGSEAGTEPDSAAFVKAIEAALAAK